MNIKEIKQFISDRGVDKHFRLDMNGGGVYLYNLLFDFNNIVKRETKNKLLQELKRTNIDD